MTHVLSLSNFNPSTFALYLAPFDSLQKKWVTKYLTMNPVSMSQFKKKNSWLATVEKKLKSAFSGWLNLYNIIVEIL